MLCNPASYGEMDNMNERQVLQQHRYRIEVKKALQRDVVKREEGKQVKVDFSPDDQVSQEFTMETV